MTVMKKLVRGFGLGAFLGLVSLGSVQAEALRFASFSGTDEPNHRAAVAFADQVKERTGGALTVDIFPNSQLGGEVDAVEGVVLGTIDLTPPSAAVLANFVPEMNVLNMPFAFRDWDHYMAVLDGPIYGELSSAAAAKGIRLLGFWTSGPRHVMSRTPVNSIDDLKGMKIRTVQNPVHVATFNAFGANATAIAYPEVYGSLQTGVVDAGDAANTNFFTQKFYEVAPNWAQLSWLYYSNAVVMSETKFQALPADQQKILLEVGESVGRAQRIDWRESDDKLLESLKAAGVNVTTPDPAPFRAAVEGIYAEFLKTDGEKKLFGLISSP